MEIQFRTRGGGTGVQITRNARGEWEFVEPSGAITRGSRCKFHWDWLSIASPASSPNPFPALLPRVTTCVRKKRRSEDYKPLSFSLSCRCTYAIRNGVPRVRLVFLSSSLLFRVLPENWFSFRARCFFLRPFSSCPPPFSLLSPRRPILSRLTTDGESFTLCRLVVVVVGHLFFAKLASRNYERRRGETRRSRGTRL